MSTMRLLALTWELSLLVSCHGSHAKDGRDDSDSDSGSDTSADSDSDTSADSESDSDGENDSDSDSGEPPPERCPLSEGWAYVSAGIRLACGVHTDGCAECWGLEGLETNYETGGSSYTRTGEDLPPDDSFVSIAVVLSYGADGVMGNQACGVRTDGSVTCWGRNDLGQSDAPAGTFSMVDVFDVGSCGLRTEGNIECWGDPESRPPAGKYDMISIGYPIGVALDASGSVTSWLTSNVSGYKLPETQKETLHGVSAGGDWACAIRSAGSLFCWSPGLPEYEEHYANFTPPGTFTAVSVGGDAACALQPDGHPLCFGRYPDLPEYAVPDATFTQISTGWGFVCGITTEQGILCWGENGYGQATPPT